MRSGDLLSEGIIYVREGGWGWCCSYGAGGGTGGESGGQRVGLYVCVRTCVRARDKNRARPNQTKSTL